MSGKETIWWNIRYTLQNNHNSFTAKKAESVWLNQLIEANEVCIIFLTALQSVHASVGAIWFVFIIQRNAKSREMNVNVFLVIAYLKLHRGVDISVVKRWSTGLCLIVNTS